MERDFKGIWIPKEIWLSKDLTLQEKVFLVEISSLDNEQGCFAENGYFAEFFGVSKTRVSIIINSLVKKGYITSTIIYKEGTKQILKRVLKESYIGYTRKVKEPIQEKFIDNNISNNTKNKDNKVTKKSSSKKISKADAVKLEINKLEDISDKLKKALIEFVDYRKSVKKNLITFFSINKTLDGLRDKTKFENEEELIDCIDNSMCQGYLGIFSSRNKKKVDRFNNKATETNFSKIV